MKPLTHGSLFAGIGGFDLGFERAGIKTVWQVEIDPFCRKVLAKNFPNVKQYSDVRRVKRWPYVDVISGGFPCQDISNAGLKAGIEGKRSGLWKHMFRAISAIRPKFVVVENVAALLVRGIGRVLGDLASIGFDAEWNVIRACDFGAPHRRERVWIVAYPSGQRLEGLRSTFGVPAEIAQLGEHLAIANAQALKGLYGIQQRRLCAQPDGGTHRIEWAGQQWDETRPVLHRVDDGLRHSAYRISAIGNAIVPQIAEWIGKRIVETNFGSLGCESGNH
jgi:DNA (cytosine-5)-methyltransferase 1